MIRFCNLCGAETTHAIPAGDHLPRHMCPNCGHIQYENPRLIVGCVATWDERILLCRRAIEPRQGFWTLPAGFMENGETTAAAAIRETAEEAGAQVRIEAAFAMVSIAHIGQVHLFYRAHLLTPHYLAGEESLEVGLFDESEIPWRDLAFRSVAFCLEKFCADRRQQRFAFHETELDPLPEAN